MKLWMILLMLVSLSACAKPDKTYQNFCKRFYENANRIKEAKDNEELSPPHKIPPSFDQYQRDRRSMLKGSPDYLPLPPVRRHLPFRYEASTTDDIPNPTILVDESLLE